MYDIIIQKAIIIIILCRLSLSLYILTLSSQKLSGFSHILKFCAIKFCVLKFIHHLGIPWDGTHMNYFFLPLIYSYLKQSEAKEVSV